MRGTVMYGPGDVRVEDVPEPQIVEPTDAIIRIVRACVCGRVAARRGRRGIRRDGRTAGDQGAPPPAGITPRA